jgi:hypothetical protein
LAEADAESQAIFPWGVPPHWRGREDSAVHIAQCLLSYVQKLIIVIISLLILLYFMVYHPFVVLSVIIYLPSGEDGLTFKRILASFPLYLVWQGVTTFRHPQSV